MVSWIAFRETVQLLYEIYTTCAAECNNFGDKWSVRLLTSLNVAHSKRLLAFSRRKCNIASHLGSIRPTSKTTQ